MSLKAKIEAIIYAAEEPVSLEQMLAVVGEELQAELAAEQAQASETSAASNSAEAAADSQQGVAAEVAQAAEAEVEAEADQPPTGKRKSKRKDEAKHALKMRLKAYVQQLTAEYDAADRGMEIREVAGGFRMATKPEHHDAVRSFAKSLKSPVRLSLQALETLAVIAYKQPVTAPEISEIRGVDSSAVLATLIDRKLITTAGRKAVIGRPILYKTTKEFLMRFGLSGISDLPSIEEFEKLAAGESQQDLFSGAPEADATGVPDDPEGADRTGAHAFEDEEEAHAAGE